MGLPLSNLSLVLQLGSRWGIKGVEDLGNGYKVGFILEQGFTIDDGAEGGSNQAFNRESSLYLDGSFGRVTFGRLELWDSPNPRAS